jgi:hypothetical protein
MEMPIAVVETVVVGRSKLKQEFKLCYIVHVAYARLLDTTLYIYVLKIIWPKHNSTRILFFEK